MTRATERQASLFEAAPELPEGMVYRPDFISADEERTLAAWLGTLPFEAFQFRGYEGRRQVVSFGWKYDFNRTRLERAADVPSELAPLRARAGALAGRAPDEMAQVLINKYEPGAPIGWHRDRPAFAEVVGVSVGAACPFRMRRRSGAGFERRTITLEPRSAYLLSGPAREVWEHSIPPVEQLRYSITFRSFRPGRARP